MRYYDTRRIALLLIASLSAGACTTSPDYGSSSQRATACVTDEWGSGSPICPDDDGDEDEEDEEENADDIGTDPTGVGDYDENTEHRDWTQKSTEVWDDVKAADYANAQWLPSLLEGGLCYTKANFNNCADPDLAERVRELEKKLADKKKIADAKGAAAKAAASDLLTAADIKMAMSNKFPIVMKNGKRTQKVSGVPHAIREKIKAHFTEANAEANGGWVYDEAASNALEAPMFMTQEELDNFVDATNKGGGDVMGMQAIKVNDRYYALVQGNNVVLFEYKRQASNPYKFYVPAGLVNAVKTWPDTDGAHDKFLKWLIDHRWRAYFPVAKTIIGTDPARTPEQMREDAIARAIQEAKDKKNPLNWETVYEVIKILPITGTIDAIQRGDCPDAIASGLTDVATLIGFWPAKIFRIGKLKVPAYVVMMALDGAAVSIRIAYEKEGAWVEAVVTVMFQARALKKAFAALIKSRRAHALAAGLPALALACDKAEAAFDEAIAAEDEVLKARDELDKARMELEKNLKIPCDFAPPDDDDDTTVDTGDTCADTFDGTLAEAYALRTDGRTVGALEPSDADEVAALQELDAAQVALEDTLLAGPVALAPVCTADETEVVVEVPEEPEPVEEPVLVELAPSDASARVTTDAEPLHFEEPKAQEPVQTQPVQTQPTQPVQSAPVCQAPAPHTPVSDLVKRYEAAAETVKKMQNVMKDKRATAERALIESLTITIALAYGIGTDTLEKFMQEHVSAVMKELEKNKIAWNSDIERDVRLTYLILVSDWATTDRKLDGLPVKVTGDAKTDVMKKLKEYQTSYLNIRMAEGDNMLWPIRRGAVAIVTVIGALPKLEEWVKNCTPITPEMLKEIGLPAQGKDPITITPEQWVAYVKKVEEALAKYEESVKKAAKVVLKE